MRRITPVLAIGLLGALTVFSGVLQGRLSHRWGMTRDSGEAANVLKQLPQQFAGWRLADPETMREAVKDTLQCEGYVLNKYVHESGAVVNFAILLGPPGPISVHTPEICYSSREYTVVQNRDRVNVECKPEGGEFWRTIFRSKSLDAPMMHVYYAWSDGGEWNASDSPRFEYAGRPYLFKLQLAGWCEPSADAEAMACESFLKDFVPVWSEAVSSLNVSR